jgi:hypothetical protein
MPFKKITSGKNKGKYRHDGRVYTAKQVKFYYASKGTFKYGRGRKKSSGRRKH